MRYFLVLACLWPGFALSQNWTISGTISDSLSTPLVGATVVLLQANDSVLVSFGLTNAKGFFKIGGVKPGEYLLQASYLGYETRRESLALGEEGGSREIGQMRLAEEVLLAEAVEIEAEAAPIVIKGDTIEYNADAFGTQPNATVEELLRQLPGVEVGRDGNVKAQGKNVQRVLVDGKEFFGDDPKMATQNLPADAVDKVQVFEKASEMAEFTGIDDGQAQQTINLQLKEGKKQGGFGKVSGGYGSKDRYAFKGNFNRFRPKLQLSALGSANNINQSGFSMDEFIGFMGGLRGLMMGGGGGSMRINLNTAEVGIPINQGVSDGFTATQAGGLNLNYELSKKSKLSFNYFYSGLQNESARELFRESILPGERYLSEENSQQKSQGKSHRANLTFRQTLDSSQQLIFRANLRLSNSQSRLSSGSTSRNLEEVRQNLNERNNQGTQGLLGGESRLTYRKRFRKAGRNFSSQVFAAVEERDQSVNLYAQNSFFPDDPIKRFADTLQQDQQQGNEVLNYEVRLTYTEPIAKKLYLGLEYVHSNFGEETERLVEDLLPNRRRNEGLSYHFRRGFVFDQGGVKLRRNTEKVQLQAGVELQSARLQGALFSLNDSIDRNYLSWLPSLSYRYEFGTSTNIDLSYETALRAPAIEQLQPILDNRDPLNIYQGNPNLQAAYEHAVQANFFTYSSFSFTSFFVFLRATFTKNQISQARTVDSLFRQVITPINVAQDWTIEGSTSFSTPLRFIKSKISLDVRPQFKRSLLLINEQLNRVDRWSGSFGGVLENRKKDLIDLALGAEWTLNQTRFSEANELNQQFMNQRYSLDARWRVADNWSIQSSFDYEVYGGQAFREKQIIPLWEASLSRFFLQQRAELKFSASDLLNQRLGFSRVSQYNYFEEERILSLSRYFLLTFTYNLSKVGGGSSLEIR